MHTASNPKPTQGSLRNCTLDIRRSGLHHVYRPARLQCRSLNVAKVLPSSNSVCGPQDSDVNRRQLLGILGGSVLALAAGATCPDTAWAGLKDYNLVDPEAPIEEVSVQLGTKDGQLVYVPDKLEFTQGRVYKLKLSNPSTQTHYFTALEFASKIYTVFLLAGEPAVEVKGSIAEVELKGGASATWVFIPIKPGTYPLRCTKKGHDAMLGTIVVRRA